eukprot:m.66084 g.66084  ORF g.66084 m.66084 type:complete len:316 (+) comp9799_c0_seq1:1245-2192(+)
MPAGSAGSAPVSPQTPAVASRCALGWGIARQRTESRGAEACPSRTTTMRPRAPASSARWTPRSAPPEPRSPNRAAQTPASAAASSHSAHPRLLRLRPQRHQRSSGVIDVTQGAPLPERRRWGTAASRSVPTITPVPAVCRIPSPPSPVRCAFTSADPCHVCRRFGERRVTPRGSPHVGWCYPTGAASCCCVVSPINSARATADKCPAKRCRCQRLQHATARASMPRDPSPAPGERLEGVRGRLLQAGGPLDTGRPTDATKLLSFSGGFEVIAAVARVPQRPAGWPRFSCCPNPRSAHPATGLLVVARLCSADHVG